jgi:hypothetical protein
MSSPPPFTPGRDALVSVPTLDAPLAFVVEAVQGDRVTLGAKRDAEDTNAMRGIDATALTAGVDAHVQYVDRFGVYDVDAPVLQRTDETVVLGVATDGEHVRRRAYVRLHEPLDATCLLLDAERNEFADLHGTVVDVGGGGAALSVPAIAPTGATVVCSIAMPAGAPVVVVGHSLASDADPRDEPERRHVRVQFTLIAEADRDRLLAFILESLAGRRAT